MNMKVSRTKIVSHVHGHFLSDLYVPVAVIFCHNFRVKLFNDNSRVYCLGHLCNVPIFGSHCSMIGDDFQGLGQHDHRGSSTLLVNLESLDGLYDAQLGSLIIFHHWDHSCAISFGSIAFRLFL
jgi:hypothetical protein